MIGSLNKIWPWKRTLSTMTNRHGDIVPKLQENILPQSMEVDPQLSAAVICAITGFFLIFLIEKIAAKQNTAT
jgi:putative membrane protein